MIHALPGMGGDQRMFPEPWSRLPDFRAHDWRPHTGARTMRGLAERVCSAANITDGDTLVGASLGGMIAGELAKLRRLRAVFLIGGALHPRELNRFAAAFHPAMAIVPMRLVAAIAAGSSRPLAQMFADADPRFVRDMTRAIFRWEGFAADRGRVFRIHGRHDRLIPAPAQADLLLDGGHALSLSHPEACVRFVEARLADPA